MIKTIISHQSYIDKNNYYVLILLVRGPELAETYWCNALICAGPIASYMTNRLGWRLTTIIGSVLASAGLCLSAVAPSVFFLYFTAGGLLGLGLGIIYLPRLDCITQYFDKKRPFVTGIAICGSGIGTFIMAPLTDV